MPKIPTYNQRTSAPSGRSGRVQATKEIQNLGVALPQDHTSQALQGLGSQVQRYASQEMAFDKKMRQQAETVKAAKRLSDFEIKLSDDMRTIVQESSEMGEGITQSFGKSFDDGAEHLLSEINDPDVKQQFRMKLINMRSSQMRGAMANEAKKSSDYKQNTVNATGDNYSGLAFQFPHKWEDYSKSFDNLVDSMGLPSGYSQKTKEAYKDKIKIAAGASLAGTVEGAQEVLEMTKQGQSPKGWMVGLNAQQIASIKSKAERTITSIRSTNKESKKMLIENSIAEMGQGYAPTFEAGVEDFKEAYPRTWQKEYFQYETAKQFQVAFDAIKELSPVQSEVYLDRFRPKKGDANFAQKQDYFEKLVAAEKQKVQMLKTDPASFVLGYSEDAQALRNEWLTTPSDNPVRKASAFQAYAVKVAGEQDRLGLSTPSFFTKTMEESMIQEGDAIRASNPPAYIDYLDRLENQSGMYWPQVFRQFSSNPAFPDAGRILTSVENKNARSKIANYEGISDAELFKDMKDDRTAIQESIISNEVYQNFIKSLEPQVGGAGVEAVYRKYAERLAGILLKENKGKSEGWFDSYDASGEAVPNAIDMMIGQQYDLEAFNTNPSLRIPKKHASQTKPVLKKMIESIVSEGVLDFGDRFQIKDSKQLKEVTKSMVLQKGTWIPTDGETGLTLAIRDSMGIYKPVLGKDKTRIKKTWADFNTLRLTKRKESFEKQKRETKEIMERTPQMIQRLYQ